MEIVDIGSEWYKYRLSTDGTTFSLFTDKGEIEFLGIWVMAMQPSHHELQAADLRKEIYSVEIYKPLDHIVDHREYYGSPSSLVTTIAIGPPWLKVVHNFGNRKTIKKWKAFYIAGDDLAITLICNEVARRDLPVDLLEELSQQSA